MPFDTLFAFATERVLFFGASTTRLAIAFMVLPLFSSQLVPALVRNALFVALSLVVFTLHPPVDLSAYSGYDWGLLLVKEAFVGLALGLFFGLFVWAFQAAGMIIDTQIGASLAMIFDPIAGHEVTLIGEFIGRWINYVFLASGGLLLLTTTVLDSFAIWPLTAPLPDLRMASLALFENEASRFMHLVLMIAAPVIVVVFVIDMSMGLLNRFSQRLNVFFLSISLKGLAALLMLLMLVPVLVERLDSELQRHQAEAARYLDSLFVPDASDR